MIRDLYEPCREKCDIAGMKKLQDDHKLVDYKLAGLHLREAANRDQLKMVEYYVDLTDGEHIALTLMYLVKYRKQPKIVKYLLTKTFNITTMDKYKKNVLMYAARHDDHAVLDQLFSKHVEKNDPIFSRSDVFGYTCLMHACMYGHLGSVKRIVSHSDKESWNKMSIDGDSSLGLAVKGGYKKLVRFLSEKCDCVARNRFDETVLMMAAYSNKFEIFELLMNKNCYDIEDQNIHKQTCLFYAIKGVTRGDKDTKIIEYLLNKDAEMETRDQYGNTALMYAVKMDSLEAFELLVNKGASLEVRDNLHNTLMMTALDLNRQEIIEYLVNEKLVTVDQETLNCAAAWRGDKETFLFLRQHCVTEVDYCIIQKYCEFYQHTELSELLKSELPGKTIYSYNSINTIKSAEIT